MNELIDSITDILDEVRRRAPSHFAHHPLSLSPMGADAALGARLHAARELVHAVADAAAVPTSRTIDPAPDAVGELVAACVRQACAATPSLLTTPLPRQDIAARTRLHLGDRTTGTRPAFTSLPGLARRQTDDGTTHYFRCGTGPAGLLLVNAFGLTLDIWHDLAQELSARFTLFVIDDAAPVAADGVPCTSYDTHESVERFSRAARAVLSSEGRRSCHVASWCSGAKLALTLARTWPQGVQSLMLFAPSFAGMPASDGGDSAFEASLHTMCKLVDRMPQSADSMAKSMMALLTKSAHDGVDPFTQADSTTLPWFHAPFSSAANMVAYSRQLLNFRAHSLEPAAGAEPLSLPVLLVTGSHDASTSTPRAREICHRLASPVHVELAGGSHYVIHQNSGLVAALVQSFVEHGPAMVVQHPRLRRMPAPACEVSGEL